MEASIFKAFTKWQWIAFLLCGSMYFISDSVYSLQGPLYPQEAQKRNVSGGIFGLVLGVYEIVQMAAVPAVSAVSPVLGPRTTFNFAAFLAGSSCIAFGFLDYIASKGSFVAWSFVLRIFQAIGEAGIYTTVFAWIGTEFPDAAGQIFGALETAFGGGTSLGPAIGAALYALGNLVNFGYTLPFLVIGLLHFLLAAFSNCTQYSNKRLGQSNTFTSGGSAKPAEKSLGFLSILRSKRLILYSCAPCLYGLNSGVLTALLEPYLRAKLNTSKGLVACMFLLQAVAYSLTAGVVGYFTDMMKRTMVVLLVVVGASGSGAGFWLLDPVSFFLIQRSIFWVSMSLLCIGISQSFLNIPGFVLLLRQTRKMGLSQDVAASYSSSLWFSSFSLGSFIGPLLGGALFDKLDSSNTFLVIGILNFAMGAYFLLFVFKLGIDAVPALLHQISGKSAEETPLLHVES